MAKTILKTQGEFSLLDIKLCQLQLASWCGFDVQTDKQIKEAQ